MIGANAHFVKAGTHFFPLKTRIFRPENDLFPENEIFRKFPEKNFIFPLAFSAKVCYYINVVSAILSPGTRMLI